MKKNAKSAACRLRRKAIDVLARTRFAIIAANAAMIAAAAVKRKNKRFAAKQPKTALGSFWLVGIFVYKVSFLVVKINRIVR